MGCKPLKRLEHIPCCRCSAELTYFYDMLRLQGADIDSDFMKGIETAARHLIINEMCKNANSNTDSADHSIDGTDRNI